MADACDISAAKSVIQEISKLIKNTVEVETGHVQHHDTAVHRVVQEIVHLCGAGFDLLGLLVILLAAVGLIPSLLNSIYWLVFYRSDDQEDSNKTHIKWLQTRMRFTRGLILGLDLMVASDVIETMLSEVDLMKLFFIMGVRSWLGFERTREFAAMDKEAKEDEAEPNERKSAKNHLSANSFSTKKEAKADEKEQSEGKSDRETLSTQRSFRKGGR